MSKPVLLVILSFIVISSTAQNSVRHSTPKLYSPKETVIYHTLGERVIQIRTFQYGDAKDKVYVNLHDDEMTAINGAKKLLERKGGYLIKIENYRTRNIRFKLEGKYYTVDPNRIFSRIGIERSLIIFGNTSPKAVSEIERFANRILQLIPPNPSWIIALHNNTNGKYSINSYLPGGEKEKDAKELNVNSDLDADDFFLTTDSLLFNRLANEKYNTILQDNVNAKKDGSLSVYCGERNIHYVNCETEHGRQPEYDEMIVTAAKQIEGKDPAIVNYRRHPGMVAYNYKISPTKFPVALKIDTDILFGEKKIGLISTVATDSSRTITGVFEMTKDFPLSSDMDFFIFITPANSSRLELRIDPTRKKELLNPQSSTIAFNTKLLN